MIESPIATTTGRIDDGAGFLSVAGAAGEHPVTASIAQASRIAEAWARIRFTNAKSTPAPYENAARVNLGLRDD